MSDTTAVVDRKECDEPAAVSWCGWPPPAALSSEMLVSPTKPTVSNSIAVSADIADPDAANRPPVVVAGEDDKVVVPPWVVLSEAAECTDSIGDAMRWFDELTVENVCCGESPSVFSAGSLGELPYVVEMTA